jgi:hypothetical protein
MDCTHTGLHEQACPTDPCSTPNTAPRTVDYAREYLAKGWQPLPLPHGEKAPILIEWQHLAVDDGNIDSLFAVDPSNIGIRLGAPSNGLVDVDLDCSEAIALAPSFLPPTTTFGRASKPASHRPYVARPCPKTAQFKDVDGKMLVELRSSGGQTMFPPSVHPSGEPVTWDAHPVEITEVDGDRLVHQVETLASVVLVARHWPAVGSRQDAAMALAGCLLGRGWPPEQVEHFIDTVARAAGDEEADKRVDCVSRTYDVMQRGEAVTGFSTLKDIIGDAVTAKLKKWLGIKPGVVAAKKSSRSKRRAAAHGERPIIELGPDEMRANDEGIQALATDPDIYQRGGILVRVQVGDAGLGPAGVEPARIVPLASATLRERLTAVADWVEPKVLRDGSCELAPAHPPAWAVAAIDARGAWPGVRQLIGIVEAPTLRPDGTVLEVPGYDPQTGLLYLPSTTFPPVPAAPSRDDAVAAANELLDLVADFPFASPAGRSGWLSALLTPLARYAFQGPAPMFVIDANTPGTGKGLQVNIISVIVCGGTVAPTPQAENEAEERKSITAAAIEGRRLIVVDNLVRPLGSGALEAVLTSTRWRDRVLGLSKLFEGDVLATWLATGNNVAFRRKDTIRRVVHVRLETPLERPETRTGFKYPDLIGHVRAHREQLVVSALTVLRAYCAAGRPDMGLTPWGSFEGWSGLVRAAVTWLGLQDPADTRDELAQIADTEAAALVDLLTGWEELCIELKVADKGCTVAQAIAELEKDEAAAYAGHGAGSRAMKHMQLRDALGELVPTSPGRLPTVNRVGKKLGELRNRVVAGKRLEARTRQGANYWLVTRVSGSNAHDGNESADASASEVRPQHGVVVAFPRRPSASPRDRRAEDAAREQHMERIVEKQLASIADSPADDFDDLFGGGA